MDTPIYSNDIDAITGSLFSNRVISLLSEVTVCDFNGRFTDIPHGVFIFPQYKEKAYIINGYAEDVFKSSITQLYVLLHDSAYRMIHFLLEPVQKDGKEAIKPFLVTDSTDKENMEQAESFIYDIESVRHYEQHLIKRDSEVDKATERAYRKVLKKITKKEVLETQDDWEKCINWIVKNCNIIEGILDKRIRFIVEDATDAQKQFFLGGYYGCLEKYYEKNLEDVVQTVYQRRHDKKTKAYIKAIVQEKEEELIDEAIKLLKKSDRAIDPYVVIVQATDLHLK